MGAEIKWGTQVALLQTAGNNPPGLHGAWLHHACSRLPAPSQQQPPARLPGQGHTLPTLGRGFKFSVPILGAGDEEGPGARPELLEARLGLEEPACPARPGPRKMAPDGPRPRRCLGNRATAGGASRGEGAVGRKQPRRRRGAEQHAATTAQGAAAASAPVRPGSSPGPAGPARRGALRRHGVGG